VGEQAGGRTGLGMASFRRAVWLLPAAFGLHVLEESRGFTEWAKRHTSERYTQADFVRNNALGLLMTTGTTVLVSRGGSRPVFLFFYSTVLTQQALFNPLFHAGTTVTYRAYSPGLVTSVVLFLPLWYHLTHLALREGRISNREAMVGSVFGGLIHTIAVAQQVFFVALPFARGRRSLRREFAAQPRPLSSS
jgi:Protein of unknown function with HXXEE motif